MWQAARILEPRCEEAARLESLQSGALFGLADTMIGSFIELFDYSGARPVGPVLSPFADDTLSRRFLKDANRGTEGNVHTVDLERMLADYCVACGWDEAGKPFPETLKCLQIEQ